MEPSGSVGTQVERVLDGCLSVSTSAVAFLLAARALIPAAIAIKPVHRSNLFRYPSRRSLA